MQPKFVVGQMVRYVGKQIMCSPPYGAIGKVIKLSRIKTDFQVDFNIAECLFKGDYCWYSEDELEPVDNIKSMKNEKEMAVCTGLCF